MLRLCVLLTALWLVFGCAGTGRVAPPVTLAPLRLERQVGLGTVAADLCRDQDALLVLENSGTRIIRYRLDLTVLDTLPLSDRLSAPAGLAADRFYVYLYDGRTLYRMAKDKLLLQPWLGNVRVAGLATYEPGIMLVSDVERGAIWYKGLFGESRQFLSPAEVTRPGAMVSLGGGTFAVLSGESGLVFFSRSGVVQRSVRVAPGCDLMAVDQQGRLCLGRRGRAEVWILAGNHLACFGLPDSPSPLAIAIADRRLLVLDSGTRIVAYQLPGAD